MTYKEITTEDFESTITSLEYDVWLDGDYTVSDYFKIGKLEEFITYFKNYIKQKKDKKEYYYLVTFTLKETPTSKEEDKIQEYIYKQFKRAPLQVEEAYGVKEYTKKGVAHWHISCKTLKYLAKDRFNYYTKNYGFVDISKTYSQTLKYSKEYINKCNDIAKIV